MGAPFWTDDPDPWNQLYINDYSFAETTVDISGDLGNDWDVQKAPGADGAPATNKGYEPCKPQVSWTLYTEEHLSQYEALLAEVQPKPGKAAPKVVTVIHPQLQIVKKEKFRIVKIHLLKKGGPGMMLAQFDLLEYFAAPKAIPGKGASDNADKASHRAGERGLGFVEQANDSKPSKKVTP